ncbi:leucine-rich repeat domain-containing protein [Anatilimnocola floriformis]|uniref:leucine-rich repeat domain-containing protein n=1 Tax=Anatilimnocola floriformis TaxID=2948575 RepID=UPI0020C49BD6|nr:hypothetical protein [Anatilimnocola floriformis]
MLSHWSALTAFCEKHNLGFGALPRAFFRFRLRTLLIVTTLLAVILGIVGNYLIHIRTQSAIAAQIKAVDGWYSFENRYTGISGTELEWDRWNREHFGEHTFRHIRDVHLSSAEADNKVLPLLHRLSRLEALELSPKELMAENLRHVARCRSLRTLVIYQEGECASLLELRQLANLRQLWLRNSDEGRLLEISMLPHLEELSLRSPHTSLAVIAELKRLPKLKTLEISSAVDVAQPEICTMLVGLDQLETLVLDKVALNSHDLKKLTELPQLRKLFLCEIPEVNHESTTVLRQLDKLQYLRLPKHLTDESLAALAGMPQLEFLNLNESDITDASIPMLHQFPKLRELHIVKSKLSADGIMKLAEGSLIRELWVTRNILSQQQEDKLRSRKPHISLNEQ